jgi:hypothetical protein
MNYSSLVIKTDFDKVKDKDVITKINDYQYAFDGNKKTKVYNTKVSPPLGMKYFADTGIKCSNKKKNIYTFVDAKPSEKNILSSASLDLKKIDDSNEKIENPNFNTTKCTKKLVNRTTVGLDGKSKKKSHYVGIETFVTPSLQKMNIGQQFFIGSFAVLGLFLFYKAYIKR